MYDQWAIAGRRHGKSEEMRQRMAALEGLPTFTVEWKCDLIGEGIMTDQKPDLAEFDPGEWEFSADVSQRDAIRVMNEGGVVWNSTFQMYFRLRYDGVFCCFYTGLCGEWVPSAIPNGIGIWRIAIRKPKPEPVKPAEPQVNLHETDDAKVWAEEFCKINTASDVATMIGWFASAMMTAQDCYRWRLAEERSKGYPTADDILNALKCGKRVVDADGCEVDLFWRDERHGDWIRNVHFPLTIKPEPKPRRRVTREEAIIAMVKDQGQHAWLESGHEIRMWNGVMCQGLFDGTWIVATGVDQEFLYLDPPEGEG